MDILTLRTSVATFVRTVSDLPKYEARNDADHAAQVAANAQFRADIDELKSKVVDPAKIEVLDAVAAGFVDGSTTPASVTTPGGDAPSTNPNPPVDGTTTDTVAF